MNILFFCRRIVLLKFPGENESKNSNYDTGIVLRRLKTYILMSLFSFILWTSPIPQVKFIRLSSHFKMRKHKLQVNRVLLIKHSNSDENED